MLKIQLTPKAADFVDALEAKHYKQVVRRVFALAKNPEPQDSKPLEGYPYFRVDQGEYRIIYEWDDEVVFINLIGKRNDDEVYKRLKQSERGPR